jgi:hypothetical protein
LAYRKATHKTISAFAQLAQMGSAPAVSYSCDTTTSEQKAFFVVFQEEEMIRSDISAALDSMRRQSWRNIDLSDHCDSENEPSLQFFANFRQWT